MEKNQLEQQITYLREVSAKQEIKIRQLRDIIKAIIEELEPYIQKIKNTPKVFRFWSYIQLGVFVASRTHFYTQQRQK